jgi:eukaryotic-like serine/threonine-protein kinase
MPPIDGVPSTGDIVAGKYILRERIGEGGMGIVFLADQPSLGRTVAIKLLQPALTACDALVRRLHTEAVAACRVQHPGAVAIIDFGTTDEGTPFIAMEHVPGRSLRQLLAEEEIPLPRALKIVQQLLRTLQAAHARGVIHADIKSDNVIVEHTAGGDTVTLIDFGLARLDGRWEHGDYVSGTPEYMAPELVRGEPPTVPTDLYGVGVILYELLTGRTPFEGGSTDEVLRRQLEDEVILPSLWQPDRDIPAALDLIVLRALHKDPRARFASAAELAEALAAICRVTAQRDEAAGEPGARRPPIPARRPPAVTREAPTSCELPRRLHEAPLRRAS